MLSKVVTFRIPEDEDERIGFIANTMNLTKSAYMREKVLGHLDRVPAVNNSIADQIDYSNALDELRAINVEILITLQSLCSPASKSIVDSKMRRLGIPQLNVE